MRIRRLGAELRVRRRRLDAYQKAGEWPGKGPALRFELVRYDQLLLAAAEMLEVPAPEPADGVLSPEQRALTEDRLALAGLDVMAPSGEPKDLFLNGDLHI
jgi:hypothetical protein